MNDLLFDLLRKLHPGDLIAFMRSIFNFYLRIKIKPTG
jgi:hypothetical protein